MTIIKNMRDREIEKMTTITTKATFETIEEIVNPPVYELKNDFWTDIRNPYTDEMILVLINCKKILNEGFSVTPIEEQDFMENFEN